MVNSVTKQDLRSLEDKIEKRFDDLSILLSTFANDVNDKFNGINEDLGVMNEKYDHLVSTIDGFLARIDHYETELVARDAEIARLRAWVEAIAKKTGVSQPF